MIKFYVIAISGGTEVYNQGPFDTEEERDKEAKSLWADMDPCKCDNVFKLNIDLDTGIAFTGVYVGGELGEVEG